MNSATLNRVKTRWVFWRGRAAVAWSGLTRRERQLLAGAALMFCGLLVWLVLIQPPLQTIAYWQTELPKLRTQNQTLEGLLQQVPTPRSRATGQSLEHALRASLDEAGLEGRYQLQTESGNRASAWQLTFDSAPADGVMRWLLEQPGQLSLQVIEARLQRADALSAQVSAGRLSGMVSMDQAPSVIKEAL